MTFTSGWIICTAAVFHKNFSYRILFACMTNWSDLQCWIFLFKKLFIFMWHPIITGERKDFKIGGLKLFFYFWFNRHMISYSLQGISVDFFIETACSEVIAQSDYLNMTARGSSNEFVSHTPQKIKTVLGIFTPLHLNSLSAFQWPFIPLSLTIFSVC